MTTAQFLIGNSVGIEPNDFHGNDTSKSFELQLKNQFQNFLSSGRKNIDPDEIKYNPQDLPQFNFIKGESGKEDLNLEKKSNEKNLLMTSPYFDTVAMLPYRKWVRYIGVRK